MSRIRSVLGRIALTAIAGSCLGGLTATAAAGTTFCVNTVASQHCSGTLEPDLQTALTAAQTAPNDTQRNTVMVGDPGPPPATGYTYTTANPATNPVDIIGAGEGTTTLTAMGGSTKSGKVLSVFGDGSTVSDLHIVIPSAAGRTGLVLTGGSARRILVTSPSPQSHTLTGVILEFGSSPTAPRPSLTQSRVLFPATGSGSGTGVETGVGAIISDIQVVAQITDVRALEFHPPNSGYPSDSTVRRVKVAATPQPGGTTIGLFVEGTTVNADNIALRMSGGSGGTIGAEVVSDPSEAATLNLSHASVYGNADASPSPPTSVGVLDTTAFESAAANVRNSIFRNFSEGTSRSAVASGADAEVRYDYSDYDSLHQIDSNSSGGTGAITDGIGNLHNVGPGWLRPAAGDFRLRPSSPVINKGDPAGLNPAIESIIDILGHPRISGHRRDMGAVEYQFPPRFALLTGRFDPANGKIRLPARCDQPVADRCHFKLTLKAKLKRKVHGKKKHKKITLSLTGSAGGGKVTTLAAKLHGKALRFVAGRAKLTFAVSGTVTDAEGVVAPVAGHVTLTSGPIKH